MCAEDRNLNEPTSPRSTQVPRRTQPIVQKGTRFSAISHNAILVTRGSVFLRSTEKRATNTGDTRVLKCSCANLQTIKLIRCSCFYGRTSDLPTYKFWMKGWKRYEVKSIKVPSSRTSGFNWKLDIKDMDGTRTILNQLTDL